MSAATRSRSALFLALGLMTIAFVFPSSVAGDGCTNPDGTPCDPGCTKPDGTPCEPPAECFVKGNSAASIGNVQAGTVTLQSSLANHQLELPRNDLAIAISTTGNLTVEVHHKCVREYTFTWTKTDVFAATTGASTTVFPGCFGGVDFHHIPVGWDLVSINMTLAATGCDGALHNDYREITVVDPPLAVPKF